MFEDLIVYSNCKEKVSDIELANIISSNIATATSKVGMTKDQTVQIIRLFPAIYADHKSRDVFINTTAFLEFLYMPEALEILLFLEKSRICHKRVLR